MSLIWIALSMAGLMYQAAEVTTYDVKARPFSTVRLPCEFTFIQGTDQLQFSWQLKGTEEEHNIYADLRYSWQMHQNKELTEPRKPKILFSYRNNQEVPEGESYEYKGRIKLDHSAFGNGALTLLLENVTFADEGVYACNARSPYGMGARVVSLLVEAEEAPQVQFETSDNEIVASCISTGWYKNPIVTWSDCTTDLTNKTTTVKISEARPDGTHRVLSVLHYPVKVPGIYQCLIGEAEKVQQPRDVIEKFEIPMMDPIIVEQNETVDDY